MKYSMCADIMFVARGEHGPIWPDAEGIGKAMELAQKNGISGIELFDFEGRDIESISKKSKETGIDIVAFCQKNGKLLGTPGKIDEFIEGFKESIDTAKALGTTKLIVSDDFYPRDAAREDVHKAMVEGLKTLAPLAEEAGITILVEPLSGAYFRDAAEPFGIIREVNSKNILLLYDIFHFQQFAGNIVNSIKENLDLIGHIHGAGVPARCELTEGEVDYRFVLKELKDLGYDKYFGLEFFTFTDREEKVRRSAELIMDVIGPEA